MAIRFRGQFGLQSTFVKKMSFSPCPGTGSSAELEVNGAGNDDGDDDDVDDCR